jgi:arsenate reductase
MILNSAIVSTIEKFSSLKITPERKKILDELIDYIDSKIGNNEAVKLNFICTHNSRRSQLSQIWAQMASRYHNIEASCYSGGVEVTAFNERAVEAIKRAGFKVDKEGNNNPVYQISDSKTCRPLDTFSKLYNDPSNPDVGFAAIMTCSDADENCPFIPGAEKRIPLRYDDPKEFDGTPLEAQKYDERSMQIATEMFYVFSKIKK